ncbi:MAG: response regulator [Maricaulaceae bacterium]
MNPDDMLASQLWPWPDPVIKRDINGAVIFVNAAFLQSYGGQVSDWHGCAVEGWSAPVAGAVPSRFETRIASPSGELVYDWLEYIMPNGGALAIARNITGLIPQVPPQDPSTMVPNVDNLTSDINQVGVNPPADTPLPVHTPADIMASAPPTIEPEAPAYVEPVPDMQVAPQPPIETMYEDVPVTDNVGAGNIGFEYTQAEPVAEERDYQRRALPIEDDESLLGSNWRDAVIAKAVGADEHAVRAEEPTALGGQFDDTMAGSAIAASEPSIGINSTETNGATRILLAEDNAINALLTRTLLEADGCFVEVVEDGQLAVEAMRSNQYDMILMDMRMPNMDGLEATRKIRALNEHGKTIPIVALTANAFDDDRNACFDAGMNDFMTKPVSAEELQQMAETWTKQRSAAA